MYHSGEVNVVADGLHRLSMGSFAHIKDKKKELVCEVHRLTRLGVLLVDSTEGSVMVQNCLESSLEVEVKAKKDGDPILL